MSDYTTEDLEDALNKYGELILQMDSDGYPNPPELHLHDTTFEHSSGDIMLSLSDGVFEFSASAVEGIAWHKQSTDDLGL